MNKENLLKLADYLETHELPFEFDMGRYRDVVLTKDNLACGTVACALGVAPAVPGLEPPDECFCKYGQILYWPLYSRRVFGLDADSNEWEWCFDPGWEEADNTKEGAAKRIRYLLEYGRPYNWRKQMLGEEPLCYDGGE